MTRLARLRTALSKDGLSGLVVSNRTNVRYLSGFSGSSGTLVVSPDACTLVTDSRYALRAEEELTAHGDDVVLEVAKGDGFSTLVSMIDELGETGIEGDHVSWNQAKRFEEAVTGTIRPTTGLVERLRELKDSTEIDAMRRAATFADTALAQTRDRLRPGITETAFAAELDRAVIDAGADGPAFETIVASGTNAARPHHQPNNRTMEPGDLVIVDFGAEANGYRSDMTRSFVLGEASARAGEMLEAVRTAQQRGVDVAGPGVAVVDVDAACRSSLEDAGLGDYFTHGTGHGVGLDIHEAPWVNATSTATLAAGHVITVEPGVYIPEVGGVRWEDTIVITADGSEALTASPKSPQQ